jgi:short-subunit dehydrogenase
VSQTLLIVGATSAIGRAFAAELARRGDSLLLAGRRLEELRRIASDLEIRFGGRPQIEYFDALSDRPDDFLSRCHSALPSGLDGIVLCTGEMPGEAEARADASVLLGMIRVNYAANISLLEGLIPSLRRHAGGWICAITSVAGDRGRASNGLYGSSKGALGLYLQSLRARLSTDGIRVTTVKPGFVDTGMTWGLPGLFLVASPDRIARDALRAAEKNRAIVYTPRFWGAIMLVIRWLPDRIFNRLQL